MPKPTTVIIIVLSLGKWECAAWEIDDEGFALVRSESYVKWNKQVNGTEMSEWMGEIY